MRGGISDASLALLESEYADCGVALQTLYFEDVTVTLHEKETTPLERGLNVIAPLSFRTVTEGVHATLHCTLYPALCDAACSFFEAWHSNPFSQDALTALHTSLLPLLAQWGYGGSKFPHRYGVARLLTPSGVADLPLREGVRMLGAADKARTSLVTMHLGDGILRGAAGFVTAHGEVAAMAAVNGAQGARRFAELGVECAVAYRGQGIASEVTACLCGALLAKGKTPLYCHYRDNKASGALAARVGFASAGRFYTYQAWKT